MDAPNTAAADYELPPPDRDNIAASGTAAWYLPGATVSTADGHVHTTATSAVLPPAAAVQYALALLAAAVVAEARAAGVAG